MSKIAIVDFDGVIANIEEHVSIAQERARALAGTWNPDTQREEQRKALSSIFYSEQGFFDTELVVYDRLMQGGEVALAQLLQEYESVVILTSRPLSMREATLQWFAQHCPGCERITFIFKDSNERAIKTAAWKARVIAQFAEQCKTLLFIDDDAHNRDAVKAILADLNSVTLFVASSLEEGLRINQTSRDKV